jgi:hypothetical protein
MLRLNFFDEPAGKPALVLESSDVQVTGGRISVSTASAPIVTYCDAGWRYHRTCYSILAVTGGACLLFGIRGDPTFISDCIDHFYFMGASLSANGVGIAKYVKEHDMWQGIQRPIWWHTMRILSATAVAKTIDQHRALHMNPWETDLMTGTAPATTRTRN